MSISWLRQFAAEDFYLDQSPCSLCLLLVELRLLGLSSLRATMVTPTYGNQFCAVLEKAETTGAALRPEQLQALEAERLALTRLLRF